MRRFVRHVVEVILAILIVAATSRGEQRTPTSVLVIVNHEAGVDARLLIGAKVEAARILGGAGLTLVWVDCSALITSSECRKASGPAILRLQLLPDNRRRKWNVPQKALGLALRVDTPNGANLAVVFLDRVRAISGQQDTLAALTLGAVIAHEIGHLLSISAGHTEDGLMKGDWCSQQLTLIRRGGLNFSAKAIESIRQGMHQRFATASAQTAAKREQSGGEETGGLAAPPVQ